MADTFRVILRDIDGFEGFHAREFDLALGSKFPIGRASKNNTKKELMPASTNAYIDSPVISREHAVLSANTDSGAPNVFITDAGSMHGTLVNGERLTAHTPKKLSSGDKLQFGIDVNRNDEYFVARKYHFEADLAPPQAPPFSMGFTVPDSDEEGVDATSPRRGSQSNPLTIDASDSESDASDNDCVDMTIMGEGFIVDEDDDVDVDDEEPSVVNDLLQHGSFSESANLVTLAEDNYSDIDGYSTDVQDEDLDDMNTEVSLLGDSEVDYHSDELEVPDIQAAITSNAVESQPNAESTSISSVQEHLDIPTPPVFPARAFFDGPIPPMAMTEHTYANNIFGYRFPPPLPPRPSAPQPPLSDRTELPPSNRPPWFSDEMSGHPSYIGTENGDRPPVLFSPAPAPVPFFTPKMAAQYGGMLFNGVPSTFGPSTGRIQTPPAATPSDAATSTTPPPSRRTKVSIGEIVEEQPPTPTSLHSMKRKADVLDEPEPRVDVSETAPELLGSLQVNQDEVVSGATSIPADVVAQRPKKQPKSILGKIQTTAKYFGIGAAGAVGAVAVLSSLPDSFFV